MNFNKHSDLVGQHAFLSGSKYHWVNYDDDKLTTSYRKYLAVKRGTELHDFAAKCISLNIKLPKSKKALNMYVNDAIKFKMFPEQPLYYSNNAFGTADSISFVNNYLRIFDLKTGSGPVSMNQLTIYAALFCLEYEIDPDDIQIELRIYQNSGYELLNPSAEYINDLMKKIIYFDQLIESFKKEEGL